jgi:asparagine synthase (glutamine-hydrolysing)
MCGIAGYLGLAPDPDLLERMGRAQAHRGPDGDGIFVDGPVGLSHRRLSVIDLDAGAQPMTTADGRYTIVYNGEVYNHAELGAELTDLGHHLRTRCDTEVVLEAFAEWGADAFDRFNGMFALAVWDAATQTLTLARDHFGIKPLHVTRTASGAWLFASEIPALLATGLVPAAPDDTTVYRYLRHRVHDDGRPTFFAGVERLLPAEVVTISPTGVERRNFSTLRDDLTRTRPAEHGTDDETVRDFRARFTDAVALRLRSDVPVGTSLSGGLDSSAVVVTIDRLLHERDGDAGRGDAGRGDAGPRTDHVTAAVGPRQSTFSAVFPGYRNDEESYVDDAVASCTRPIAAHKTRPTSDELRRDLLDFVRTQQEPVISTGPYAQYRVMRDASCAVTVMLDGQGADELLAGYVPQLVVHLRSLVRTHRWAALPALWSSRDVVGHLLATRPNPLRRRRTGVTALLAPRFTASHREDGYRVEGDDLRSRLVHDLYVGSLPALLRYEDRNTMRFSIEGRVPFLDPNLVRAVFALPDDAVIHHGWNKRILRDSMTGRLPASIRLRRNKIGFTTPQHDWFREQSDLLRDVLTSASFAGRPYFDQPAVLAAFERWVEGSDDLDSMVFWRLVNVELWLREFIDPATDPEVTTMAATPGVTAPVPAH